MEILILLGLLLTVAALVTGALLILHRRRVRAARHHRHRIQL